MTDTWFGPKLEEFLDQGFVKLPVSLGENFKNFEKEIGDFSRSEVNAPLFPLDQTHRFVSADQINQFRLNAIRFVNKCPFRSQVLKELVPFFKFVLGEDLAVQKSMNLVVVPPEDITSVIPLHADTWTGHSRFELTILFSMTEITPSHKLFLLPLKEWSKNERKLQGVTRLQQIYEKYEKRFHFLDLKPGEVLMFWHHLPHGNGAHQVDKTHWSLNFRVKNIFTPYGEKGLGDYFIPYQVSCFNEFVFRESEYAKDRPGLHY